MKNLLVTMISLVVALATGGCADDGNDLACELSAPDCQAGFVCLAGTGDEAQCEPVCDPLDPMSCGEGLVCDRLDTGEAACFAPVVLKGRVFDLADSSAISGARVLAVGPSGEAVTDVAQTDAEGAYQLRVPVKRDSSRQPVDGTFTFRVAADGWQPYPYGIRPAIPVDATLATAREDGSWVLDNQTTGIGLIRLPETQRGLGSISGTVMAELPGSTLVVAECDTPPCPLAFADMSGNYTIFNVADGTYQVKGYKAGLQLDSPTAQVAGGGDLVDVDLNVIQAATSTLTGSIQIVNPDENSATSVVLIPESVFVQYSDTYLRGEVPPGLRDPGPGVLPDVTGAFSIEGIPDGSYVVLAAFENDLLIRDPDPKISGTQIVHITLAGSNEGPVQLGESFKITGALALWEPGADGPEAVTADGLTFRWKDDSSEDQYILTVYDAYGNVVWENDSIPGYSGSDPEIAYVGPALQPGMYYQWRAVSLKDGAPKSTTEDLLGVFYLPVDGSI